MSAYVKKLIVLLSVCLAGSAARAAICFVDCVNGNDANTGTQPASAKASIQAGVDAAAEGDTVLVAPGIYTGVNNTNLIINSHKTIQSASGAGDTIIDFKSGSGGVSLSDSMLRGFTIRNAIVRSANWPRGDYIVKLYNSILDSCVITNNQFLFGTNNTSPRLMGGPVLVDGSNNVLNCNISGNYGQAFGVDFGAVTVLNQTPDSSVYTAVRHCTIVNNRSSSGWYNDSAALCFPGPYPHRVDMDNCIVWTNKTLYYKATSPYYSITNALFVSYSDIQTAWDGTGNLTSNPLLTADCRLSSSSMCINAGSAIKGLLLDLDGKDRVGLPDMGCYEYGQNPNVITYGYNAGITKSPVIEILSVSNRIRSNYVDVDYRVSDQDSSVVEVRGFATTKSPESTIYYWDTIFPVRTVVENTGAYYGAHVATGTGTNLFVWDAGADIGYSQPGLRIHLLANDSTNLPISLHFITIPADADVPSFQISRYAGVGAAFMLHRAWVWALVKGEARREAYNLYAVGGAYDGACIAELGVPTATGRQWLCSKMGGVALASESQIRRAREATTPGRVVMWPSYYRGGVQVNAYGVETGGPADFYFVKQ